MVDIPNISLIIEQWINEHKKNQKCRQMVITGFHGILEAHKHPEFKAILNSADLWAPDGIAPVWVARLKGIRNINRTPGAEIMQAFFELANGKGYSSFFYGDTEDTLKTLKENLKRKYPGHKIAGIFSPPFRPMTPEEDDEVVKMINNAKPDVLWVGLGLPKQDRWIFDHKEKLNVPVAATVASVIS